MALWITLIVDVLHLLLCLLMGGICKFKYCYNLVPCKDVLVNNFWICRFGQPIKVNWAYASSQREDTSGVVDINARNGWSSAKKNNFGCCDCLLASCNFSFAGHFNVFVGDLSPEITDATLYACFSVYSSCS